MLSNRFYLSLKTLSPFFYNTGIFILSWDPHERLFVQHSKHSLAFLLTSVLYIVRFVFLGFQLLRFYIAKDFNNFYFVLTFTLMDLVGLGTFMLSNTSIGCDCYSVLNAVLIYLRRINRKF